MKAIGIFAQSVDNIKLIDIEKPNISEIPNKRGVLVKVLYVGVDGTDKEIIAGEYGDSPNGYDFLIPGHESFGIVEEVGINVTELKIGDFVSATVRRPGNSIYDKIGLYDFTTDDIYYERGINLLHGYLCEYYIDQPEYLVKVPKMLKKVGVLLEPTSVIEKGIVQAYEIQRRLKIWEPKKAAVLGAGTIGLLAALALRNRGLEVCVFARTKPPYLNSELLGEIGCCYHSTKEKTLTKASNEHGTYDIIFEATGYSPLVFEAMNILGKNGVLILSGVTGGGRTIEVPADKINLGFVLGNKVMVGTVNANKEFFKSAIKDLSMAEMSWPGWLEGLLTHEVNGLSNFRELFDKLENGENTIKVYCKI